MASCLAAVLAAGTLSLGVSAASGAPSAARGAQTPTGSTARVVVNGPAADVAAVAADQAAASGLDALAKGPDEAYLRGSGIVSGGLHYFSYARTYRGLPVVGGDAVVVTDAAGHVLDTVSSWHGPVRLASLHPSVSAARAAGVASAQLSRVDGASAPRLVVLTTSGRPLLAWEVLAAGVRAGQPSRLHVYVDARTGRVDDLRDDVRMDAARGFYNGQVTIDTTGGRLVDPVRPGLSCGNINTGQTYTNGGTGAGTDLQTACVDAYYDVEQETNMLSTWLGRNGLNGSGSDFPLLVGLNDVNAFWDGSKGNFGHTADNQRQATSMDVVGHEMGHAIFQFTPGGVGSGNENGGINESTGDIFGALTEHFANNPNDPPDYQVGEEVNLTGTGPIRYMYNPSINGDPNCYSSSIPNTEVHSAAGPNNHWFYLVAVGSAGSGTDPSSPTCNGTSVTGIGIQAAGKIYLGALQRKTSTWRYANVRTATLAAAVELFGANSQECRTVKAAWAAVSVPAQSGEAQCTSTPTNDFSLALNPTSGSTAPGGSVATTVSTRTTQGSAQTVTLSASGLPSGVTAQFSPASVTSGGSSTLTFTASARTLPTTATVTVTGSAASGQHTATYTLTVTSGNPDDDFSLTVNPASATVAAGGSTQATIATATTAGAAQSVGLTVTGSPTGVTATVSPATVTSGGSATLSVSVASTTVAGVYTLTVTGTGTSATHVATFQLTVTGGSGGGCGGVAAWNATTAYVPGDQVSYNGHLWNSTWWSTGAVPSDPTSWAVWSDAGPC